MQTIALATHSLHLGGLVATNAAVLSAIFFCSRFFISERQTTTIQCSLLLFSLFSCCSPIFPRPYSGSHYFSSTSPTAEPTQMWQTSATAGADDFDSPKSGALPTFQKITSSPFYSNGRNPHMGYTSQPVSRATYLPFAPPKSHSGGYFQHFFWLNSDFSGGEMPNFLL